MNRLRAIAIFPLLFISMAVLSSCVSTNVPQPGAPMITTTTIPGSAVVGVPYAGATISTTGGTTPLSYSLSSGSGPLPTGLALARDGVISGTAKAAGTFMFVVEVTDSHNPPRTALSPTFTITVTNPAPPVIQCPFTPSGGVCPLGTYPLGQTVNLQFTTSMGTGPFTWNTLTNPPYNLALGRSTGLFSGEAAQAGTNQSFTISVTDVAGQTSPTLTCTITITPGSALAITAPGAPPAGVVGVKYGSGGNGVQFSATGGLAPYVWSLPGNPPQRYSDPGSVRCIRVPG